MLPVLAVLLLAPSTVRLTALYEAKSLSPSDDVWVYEHASDPAKDAYLRIWGNSGKAVSDDPADIGQFSYGYLRWDVSKIPAGAKLTKAELIVNQVANPAYSTDDAKANPLEARDLVGEFDEKSWTFSMAAKVFPKGGAEGLFGTGYPNIISKDGRTVPIRIDLLVGKGGFSNRLAAAMASTNKSVSLALASTLDPSNGGMSSVYKVYSKDAETPENRPVLVLTFE